MFENQDKKTMISLITSLIAMTLSIVINFFLSPYIVENFGEEANGFTPLTFLLLLSMAIHSLQIILLITLPLLQLHLILCQADLSQ